jgi:hypothetical protein
MDGGGRRSRLSESLGQTKRSKVTRLPGREPAVGGNRRAGHYRR